MATIRKRGKKYQVQIRRHGHSPLSRSFTYVEDARLWARQMEAEADRTTLPNRKALNAVTLAQLVERYMQTVVPGKRGAEIESIILNAFLRDHPKLCQKALSELTTRDFVSYRDHRLKSIKPSTLGRELSPLRHMFKIARIEWGLPVSDPIKGLTLPQFNRRERRLRGGELDRLLNAAADCRDGTVACIIVFALETAMRRGEILAMRFRDLDWREPSLLIPHTKNGHARTIPLTRKALSVITPSTRDRVFPLTPNAFKLSFQRVLDRAGLDDLNFHDLRHEAISRLFEFGLSVPEVALISGHRDMRMLFRYTHPIRTRIATKLASRD
jgi:integrase